MPDAVERKIVSMVSDPLKPERVRVRVDDEVWTLDISQVIELKLNVNQTLTHTQLDALRSAAAFLAAKERALTLLSSRAYTESELGDRLRRHEYTSECIENVISWLNELGYLDDRAYAQRWVQQRSDSKGLGPIRLRHELMRKGVSPDIVADAIALIDDAEYENIAYQVARKHILREEDIHTPKARARLYGFLQRRGFSGPTIHRVIKRLFDELPA